MNPIFVWQNPEVDFPSWICDDAAPQIPEKEGIFILCGECGDLFEAGAPVVNKRTGETILPGEARRLIAPEGIDSGTF
jgi:hypothetical protein